MRRVSVLGHMALTALVIGTAAAVLGAGRVTVPLVLSTTLMWSWVPVLQLLTGLLLAGRGPRRAEAMADYFATGRYWLLWILAFAAVLLLSPQPFAIFLYALSTAVVAVALTARALVRWRRQWAGDAGRAAWMRVAVHQAITHALVIGYFAWAVALWPRIMAMCE